jgi:methionine aminopeptidase
LEVGFEVPGRKREARDFSFSNIALKYGDLFFLSRDVGNVIQKHATSGGYSVVRSYCGHGIHKLFHCAPNVPHYAKNKAVGVMKPGHCFTIEPMISEGVWGDQTWPDNWTSVTQARLSLNHKAIIAAWIGNLI